MKYNTEYKYYQYTGGEWKTYDISPPEEASVKLIVNQTELVNILCTPNKLDYLAIGFLCSTGVIDSINELLSIDVDRSNNIVTVSITKDDFSPPQKCIITTGFGKGVIYNDKHVKLNINSKLLITPDKIISLIESMKNNAVMYKYSGGIHSTAICTEKSIFVQSEDVGRHNTLDKVIGECLVKGIHTQEKIMITTGRISSEMILKSARMGIPLIASLSSPTLRAVTYAEDYGVTVVGYVGCGSLTVYSHSERLIT